MRRSVDAVEHRDDSIVLRPWREDDAPAVYAACQDREIQRWIPSIPRPYTHDDASAFVTGVDEPGHHQLAIVELGRVIGSIFLRVDDGNIGRVGYWCVSHARGRGATTRALRHLCRHAFDELGLDRLELSPTPTTSPRNEWRRRSTSGARGCCAHICCTRTDAGATR